MRNRKKLLLLLFATLGAVASAATPYFSIHVIDDKSGRGVPLVELKTTNDVAYYTDSAGYIAYNEPGLMGGDVYFSIKSDGYQVEPADGFNFRGARLKPVAGGEAELRVHRTSIAERLYRVTGEGIYRDSLLLEKPVPTKNPALNGRVMGQDSVQSVVYRGKIFWLWGDTGRPEYPLGGFACTAATSEIPGKGGLDPSVGVDLTYFVREDGFAKEMARGLGEHLVWLDALMVIPDSAGRETLLAHFTRLKSLGEPLEQGLCRFDDATETFVREATWGLGAPAPNGQPLPVNVDGEQYFYFPSPYAQMRVRSDWDAIHDLKNYEAFTCLVAGSQGAKENVEIERDAAGKAVWGWKRATASINAAEINDLLKKKILSDADLWNRPVDTDTGDAIIPWGGSVVWNDYRKKYVMIAGAGFGKPSFLGEIYYLESDRPEGPWTSAKKIITHEKHSFYNPVSHPFFDEDGGRVIYLEGTYTDTFSNAIPTPRYNYNQVMYRLDLDAVLAKPAALPASNDR